MALDFPADQYEDLPVLGHGVSSTTATELGALHFLLSVALLLWCADFAVQLNLGGVARMKELFFCLRRPWQHELIRFTFLH